MKFKSIQFSVAAMAGASILAVVAALVLYAVHASQRSEELVAQRTQALLEQAIEQRLAAMAKAQVLQIQRELETPLQGASKNRPPHGKIGAPLILRSSAHAQSVCRPGT